MHSIVQSVTTVSKQVHFSCVSVTNFHLCSPSLVLRFLLDVLEK